MLALKIRTDLELQYMLQRQVQKNEEVFKGGRKLFSTF